MRILKIIWSFLSQLFCGRKVFLEENQEFPEPQDQKFDLPLEEPTSWLFKIRSAVFRTQEGRRELMLWTKEKVPLKCFESLRILAVPKRHPAGIKYQVNKERETKELVCESSIIYVLCLEPLGEWNEVVSKEKIKGELCSINVMRLEFQDEETKTVFIYNTNGFFYPPESQEGAEAKEN